MNDARSVLSVWAHKLYLEAKVLLYVLSPRSKANPMKPGEWLASVVLFLTWGAVTAGIAFGIATPPPFYEVISGIVILVFGRMWGINLAHQAVGLSPHPDEYRPEHWREEDEEDEEDEAE